MEVIILGSGTCVPSVRRAGPAACVRSDDYTILVDSSAGTLRQLARAGVDYADVDMILYTHLHPDHVGEFVPFIFATRYAPGYSRTKPVVILAAEGFLNFYNGIKKVFGEWVEPLPGRLEINEIPVSMNVAMQFPPLTIKTAPMKHTPQSLAFRIEDSSGKSVVFSGDTEYCQELSELANGADMLISECAAPEHAPIPGHLTPSGAGKIAASARVGKLVLTHFYPDCDKSDLITPCRREFSGPVILAEDLMHLSP